MVREIRENELDELLSLYEILGEQYQSEQDFIIQKVWKAISRDPNYHIIVKIVDDKIVSTCTIIILYNLGNALRPYALLDKLVTLDDYRNNGYAIECLDYAQRIANLEGCHKIVVDVDEKSVTRVFEKDGFVETDNSRLTCWLQKNK